MNQELQNLYASKWNNLCSAMQPFLNDESLEIKPACPLLLSIDKEDEFQNADIRVMFYGQETFGWNDTFNEDMQSSINSYNKFFNSGEWRQRAGAFWNGVNLFISLLQEKYPDKKIRFIWNNVIKIGKAYDKGSPSDEIYEAELHNFSILKEEIKIIQPTIALFLTGPYYDSVINDKFGERTFVKFEPGFSERELAYFSITGVPFAFRTYHPNYLYRNSIESYFQPIINRININSLYNFNLKSIETLNEELQKVIKLKLQFVSENRFEQAARLRDDEKAIEEAIQFKL